MVDTVNTFQGESKEDPNHAAAMIAKAEGQEPPQPSGESNQQSDDRPTWLPEKFQSAEDLAKAYAELESKLGQSQQDSDNNQNTDPTQFTETEVEQYLDSKGLNFDAFAQEVMETGQLSTEAYQALEQAGIDRKIVDTYIQGQTAIIGQIRQSAFSVVGGEGEYQKLTQWAQNNLSEGEISAFNASLETKDVDQALFAIRGLHARYRSEVGVQPNLVTGQTGASSAGSYQSLAQLTEAMRDPRYEKDPAYRRSVADKLRNSSIL